MFKCYECGRIFEYPKTVKESRGEFWGAPAYEEMNYCPRCGSEAFDLYNESEEEDDNN